MDTENIQELNQNAGSPQGRNQGFSDNKIGPNTTSPKRRSNFSPFLAKRKFIVDKPIFNLFSNLKFTEKISEHDEKEDSSINSPVMKMNNMMSSFKPALES